MVRIAKKQQQTEEVRTQFGSHRVEEKHQHQWRQNSRQAVDQFDENNKKLNKSGAGQKQAVD